MITPSNDEPADPSLNLLKDLKHEYAGVRRQAAIRLGSVTVSNRQIVEALIEVCNNDVDMDVRNAARTSLVTAVHQEIIQQEFGGESLKEIKSAVVREPDEKRPGCVTLYAVVWIIGACLAVVGLYYAFTLFLSPRAPVVIAVNMLQSSVEGLLPHTLTPDELYGIPVLVNVGQLTLGAISGALLAILAWCLLIAVGLWKMKLWARLLMVGAHGLLFMIAGLTFCIFGMLVIDPAIRVPFSPLASLGYSLAAVIANGICAGWFVIHKGWDNTLP